MTEKTAITDFDLIALADGRLEDDPAHREAVERALDQDPALAARAQAYAAQTAALHRAYNARLAEPVPERIRACLEVPEVRASSRLSRIAAATVLATAASAAGWTAGHWERGERAPRQNTAQVFFSHADLAAAPAIGNGKVRNAGSEAGLAAGWLAQEISVPLHAPDLTAAGFNLQGHDIIEVEGGRTLRLTYRAADGRSFNLFLRPRWNKRGSELEVTERDGVALAHWMDGPLSSAMTSRMTREEIRDVAEAVRRGLREGREEVAGTEAAGTVPLGPITPARPEAVSAAPEAVSTTPQKVSDPAALRAN